jgi:uncharacterized protein
MDEEFFKKLRSVIKPFFKNGSGHGFDHTERVYKSAINISEGMDVDLDVVKVAALMHDICREEEEYDEIECHAVEGSKKCKNILSELKFPKEKIEKVAYAIKVHRYSKGIIPETTEARILQDADRLDALGAVCIARIFEYGGKRGRPTYNPEDLKNEDLKEEDESSLYHFYKKILKITPDKFYTSRAREIAKGRYKFVENFLSRFIGEWEGKL